MHRKSLHPRSKISASVPCPINRGEVKQGGTIREVQRPALPHPIGALPSLPTSYFAGSKSFAPQGYTLVIHNTISSPRINLPELFLREMICRRSGNKVNDDLCGVGQRGGIRLSISSANLSVRFGYVFFFLEGSVRIRVCSYSQMIKIVACWML